MTSSNLGLFRRLQRHHLATLHSACKAFVAAESSEKIRRALRRQTRSNGMTFTQGEEVFYKRNDSPRWKGPAKVIGQDGLVVFIRHGGKHMKVHSCRVQLVKEKSLKGSNEPHTVEKRKPTINDIEGKTYEDDSDDIEGDSDICNVPGSQSGLEQSQELSTEQVQDSNIEMLGSAAPYYQAGLGNRLCYELTFNDYN